ncbi:MAG: hypothetical protein GEU71_15805, partial [Actinobacteria bacterium]|nr:hypothetical protein [Actinomycetota bacterium]
MRKIFGLVLALALVAAACGGDGGPDPADDPKGALQAALDRLSEYEGVSLTMSIASDTASLVAASEGDLTEDNAQKVIDSSLTLSAVSSEDPTNAQFQLAANIAGIDNAFEMRAADNTLFLRADVSGLAEAFGADTSQLDAFEAEAGAAPGFEFVGPALEGEWIGLTGLDSAMDQLGGGIGAVETPSEEDLASIKKFTDALGDAAEVTTGDKEGPGDHLVATVNLREAYASLSEIAGTLTQVPGTELPPDSEVPDKDISVDVWIDGGNLTQAELDLTQMADLGDSELPEGVDQLAFRIGIEEFTGGVE